MVGRRAAGVLGLLGHGSHSCASVGRTPIDIRVDERADAELSGVQSVGFLQCDGYVAEGLPTLLVEILPDHGGQRRGDPLFVLANARTIGWAQLHRVPVAGDRSAALVLQVTRRLRLQRIGYLGGMYRSAEQAREGTGDRTLQLPFKTLDDAHRTSLSFDPVRPRCAVHLAGQAVTRAT